MNGTLCDEGDKACKRINSLFQKIYSSDHYHSSFKLQMSEMLSPDWEETTLPRLKRSAVTLTIKGPLVSRKSDDKSARVTKALMSISALPHLKTLYIGPDKEYDYFIFHE